MRRILLTGGTGQIGWELRQALAPLGELVAPDRARLDLGNPDSIRKAIREAQPGIIVNAAAFSSMDKAEADPETAMQVNGVAPGIIAEEARRSGALLVHYSSAYVFDGASARPYAEDDTPNPINAYGRSKLAGERAIGAVGGAHLIVRLSWIHSLRGSNFLTAFLKLAREKPELPVVDDQIGSPTWARTVAEATARVLAGRRLAGEPTGIFHLSAAGMVSRCGFAEEIIATGRRTSPAARAAPWAKVRPVATAEYPVPAARPRYSVLDNSKIGSILGVELPGWREQVRACLEQATEID